MSRGDLFMDISFHTIPGFYAHILAGESAHGMEPKPPFPNRRSKAGGFLGIRGAMLQASGVWHLVELKGSHRSIETVRVRMDD